MLFGRRVIPLPLTVAIKESLLNETQSEQCDQTIPTRSLNPTIIVKFRFDLMHTKGANKQTLQRCSVHDLRDINTFGGQTWAYFIPPPSMMEGVRKESGKIPAQPPR